MKRLLVSILSVLLLLLCFPKLSTEANAAVYSGSCGDNLTWDYDEDTKTLSIYGEGLMNLYTGNGLYVPWYYFKDSIAEIQFVGNITSIDNYAFSDCTALAYVDIPESVNYIGTNAFKDCARLARVYIRNTSCSFSSEFAIVDAGTVIFAPPDSSTEKYAQKKGLAFVEHTFENGASAGVYDFRGQCRICIGM